MSEKVASHSGVTRNNENSSTANNGRLIANRIFVGNIPSNLAERDLILLFHRFGKIRDVKIVPEHTRNKSYGFVTYFSEADARRAIQASAQQQDCVMWGDRKLNVAPAIKRNNNNNTYSPPTSSNGFHQQQSPRLINNSFHAPVSLSNVYANNAVVTPADVQQQQQTIEPIPAAAVDASNNQMYQTAVICRLPHQYPMCQFPSPPSGHFFITPGFQPYLQNGSSVANNQVSHYAPYTTNLTPIPLPAITSRENSLVSDQDMCVESSDSSTASSQQVDLVRDDYFQHNNQHRIPFDHAPIYFLKVFFTPAPLRQ